MGGSVNKYAPSAEPWAHLFAGCTLSTVLNKQNGSIYITTVASMDYNF